MSILILTIDWFHFTSSFGQNSATITRFGWFPCRRVISSTEIHFFVFWPFRPWAERSSSNQIKSNQIYLS